MRRLVLAFLLLGFVFSLFAQQVAPEAPASAGERNMLFRAEHNLVTVHFQYTPKKGSALDLRPDDLELHEDSAPQKISLLQGGGANPQTAPLEINILFAYMRPARGTILSPWMRGAKFDLAAIDDRQRVSVAIWAVGNGVRRLCGPTRDATQLDRAMEGVVQVWASSPDNDTPLLGAIGTVIQQSAQGRHGVTRIIVVLTREDIYRQFGGPEAVSAAQRNSIAIYPITVGITAGGGASADEFSYSGGTSRGSDDDMRTRASLQEAVVAINGGLGWLAKLTNGQRWDLNSVNDAVLWEKILQQLAKRIRNDYVAGYYPSSAGPVKVRKVKLSLKRGVSGQISPKELYVRR